MMGRLLTMTGSYMAVVLFWTSVIYSQVHGGCTGPEVKVIDPDVPCRCYANDTGVYFNCTQVYGGLPAQPIGTVKCSCTIRADGVNITCLGTERKATSLLRAVPSILPKNLVYLEIQYHHLQYLTASDFAQCHQLSTLNLRKNNLSKIEVETFRDLNQLNKLCINLNCLDFDNHSNVPLGILDPLENLRVLWVDINSLRCEELRYATTCRVDFLRKKQNLSWISMVLIPGRPLPDLTDKDVSLNKLTDLLLYCGVGDTFKNTTLENWKNLPITHLGVHTIYCPKDLLSIEPSAFGMLTKLQNLDLSKNPKLVVNDNWDGLKNGLKGLEHTDLSILNLGYITYATDVKPIYFPANVLEPIKGLPVKELYLDWNEFTYTSHSLRNYVPELNKLSLTYNRFFAFVYKDILRNLSTLENLEYLYLDKQTRFVKQTDPGLLKLGDPDDPFLSIINITLKFPKTLKELHLRDALDSGSLCLGVIYVTDGPLSYDLIDLSQNNIYQLRGPIVFKSNDVHHIRILNLSHCDIQDFSTKIFSSQLEIDRIDLSRNLGVGVKIGDDVDGKLFKAIERSKVKVIILTLCNIKYIDKNLFKYSRSLQQIMLSNNPIGSWHSPISHMKNLIWLDVSECRFLFFFPDTIKEIDQLASHLKTNNRSFTLDLSTNPLQIQCSCLHFLKWLHSAKDENIILRNEIQIHFFQTKGSLDEVYFLPHLPQAINDLDIKCQSTTWVIVSGSMTVFLIILLLISVIIFRRRWDIRYFCIHLVRKRKAYQELEDSRSFEYDGFIAFHEKDLRWVKQELIENVENCSSVSRPLKLCIHHRDWLPGPTIEENISHSVQNSRKTLVILSRHFIRSSWCDFEMQMARLRGFDEGQDIIIVIALEHIPIKEMSTTLINLRRTNTWMEWPEEQEAQIHFWAQLRKALVRPSGNSVHCICGNTFHPVSSASEAINT